MPGSRSILVGGTLLAGLSTAAAAAPATITMMGQSVPVDCADWKEIGPHSWAQTGTIRFGQGGSVTGNMFTDTRQTKVLDETCGAKRP